MTAKALAAVVSASSKPGRGVAYLLALALELSEWAPEESRAYIQHWLGDERFTDAHVRAVFTAVDKILRAGRMQADVRPRRS